MKLNKNYIKCLSKEISLWECNDETKYGKVEKGIIRVVDISIILDITLGVEGDVVFILDDMVRLISGNINL
jgi:hypothetical protein